MSNISDNDNICGFARVAIDAIQYKEHGLQREPLEAANSFKARIYRWQQSHLQQMFNIPMFDIPYDSFKKEIPKIEEMMIRLRKRNRQNRIELTEGFSLKSWEAMPSDKKINHTYYNCMSCQNEPSLKMLIGLFPKKKWMYKTKEITPRTW